MGVGRAFGVLSAPGGSALLGGPACADAPSFCPTCVATPAPHYDTGDSWLPLTVLGQPSEVGAVQARPTAGTASAAADSAAAGSRSPEWARRRRGPCCGRRVLRVTGTKLPPNQARPDRPLSAGPPRRPDAASTGSTVLSSNSGSVGLAMEPTELGTGSVVLGGGTASAGVGPTGNGPVALGSVATGSAAAGSAAAGSAAAGSVAAGSAAAGSVAAGSAAAGSAAVDSAAVDSATGARLRWVPQLRVRRPSGPGIHCLLEGARTCSSRSARYGSWWIWGRAGAATAPDPLVASDHGRSFTRDGRARREPVLHEV